MTTALIVGLDPALLTDDGDPINSSRVSANMDRALATLATNGVDAELFLLAGAHQPVIEDLIRVVRQRPLDVVMIGAGVRLEPSLSWFFEDMVNSIIAASPSTRLAFNEDPEAMAIAVLRVLR